MKTLRGGAVRLKRLYKQSGQTGASERFRSRRVQHFAFALAWLAPVGRIGLWLCSSGCEANAAHTPLRAFAGASDGAPEREHAQAVQGALAPADRVQLRGGRARLDETRVGRDADALCERAPATHRSVDSASARRLTDPTSAASCLCATALCLVSLDAGDGTCRIGDVDFVCLCSRAR
eukprot:4384291-Pleurochrysis_carterae.AAC.3